MSGKSRKLLLPNIGLGNEKNFLIENLSLLISSGRGVVDALGALHRGLRSRRLKKVVGWVKSDVENGMPLWRALSATALFPTHVISLVRVGEESGNLSRNLKALSIQSQKDTIFRSRVRSALMYPVFVLAVAFIIGIGIAWFILPRLSSVFDQFVNLTLPLPTRVLISAGEFFQAYGIWFVPTAVIIFFLVISIVFFVPETRFIGQWILFHIPGIRGLLRTIETARFGTTLSTLLGSGIPVVHSLESLQRATDFPVYEKWYAYLRKSVEQGNSFERSFHNLNADHLISPPVQEMIISGEQSGALPEILHRIGESFEEKSTTATKDLSVILEPILLVFVWTAVLVIALAVIMPIYGLLEGIGGSSPNEEYYAGVVNTVVPPAAAPTTETLFKSIYISESIDEQLIYENPDPASEVIGTTTPGTVHTVFDFEELWYEIDVPSSDTTGWIPMSVAEEL